MGDYLKRKQIPLNRPHIGWAERRAVDTVLRTGKLAQGAKVSEFERNFAVVVPRGESIALNSGTSALHLGLLALGIGKGDEVVVPTFTFAATANAVALTGATPVFVDIEPEFFSIDPKAVEAAFNSRTKAVIAVHLFGHPALLTDLKNICDKKGVHLVEDAAQAHLATFDGIPVGQWGAVSAFSFYPTKNMTTGEGGMAVTSNSNVARKLRLLRNQGMEIRYQNEIPGFNNRMSEISAAIGIEQLKKVARWTSKRAENAEYLSKNLVGVSVPKVHELATHVFHQYTIRVEGLERDEFVRTLVARGVDADVYYPTPVHMLPAYALKNVLPVAREVAKTCLSIPVHQNLSRSQLDRIIETVNKLAKAGV
jgi:perosamine synthetase